MNLTDDDLRFLRRWTHERPDTIGSKVLALVEEVERARHRHVTDPDGTSYCPLSEHLQREVDRLRDAVHAKNDVIHETKAERDALAAKAEAGKGLETAARLLSKALIAKASELRGDWSDFDGRDFLAWAIEAKQDLDAALARWEAANAE